MAIYNIGPGEAYTTFSDLVSGVTIAPGDIIDGGGNTFTEKWKLFVSGTVGDPIVMRNATIDGSAETHALDIRNRSHIEAYNLNLIGGSIYALEVVSFGTDENVYLRDIHITTTAGQAFKAWLIDGLTVENVTVEGSDGNGTTTFGSNNSPGLRNVIIDGLSIIGCGRLDIKYIDDLSARNISTNNDIVLFELGGSWSFENVSVDNVWSDSDNVLVSGCSGIMSIGNMLTKNAKNNGLHFLTNSLDTRSSVIDIEATDNMVEGVYIQDSDNLTFYGGLVAHNGASGLVVENTSNIKVSEMLCEYNGTDGFTVNGASDAVWFCSCKTMYNGDLTSDISGGDGFTAHGTGTNILISGCISCKNKNTAWAFVESTSGKLVNCIGYKNGENGVSSRGGSFIISDQSWSIDHCILFDNYPFNIVYGIDSAISSDSNVIYTPNYSCASTNGGVNSITFAELQATGQELGSIETDPLFVDSDGNDFRMFSESPTVVAGISNVIREPVNDAVTTLTVAPLGVDFQIQSGTTFPDITVRAPLGPKFQAISEFTGEATVDLSTFTATDNTRIGIKGIAVYDPQTVEIDKADKYLGA